MFTKGDLIWLPQETVLIITNPANPKAFRLLNKPEIGLFIGKTEHDEDFFYVHCDGQRWATNKKYIKHLRRENASKISRSIQA